MLPKLFHPLRHLAWRNSRQRTIPRVKARHLTSDPDDLRQAIVHKDMVDPITDRYHTASRRFAFRYEAREVFLGAVESLLGLHTLILIVHASGAASHAAEGTGVLNGFMRSRAHVAKPSTVSRALFLRREHAKDGSECAECAALFTVAILVYKLYCVYTCTFLCTYIHNCMIYTHSYNLVTGVTNLVIT